MRTRVSRLGPVDRNEFALATLALAMAMAAEAMVNGTPWAIIMGPERTNDQPTVLAMWDGRRLMATYQDPVTGESKGVEVVIAEPDWFKWLRMYFSDKPPSSDNTVDRYAADIARSTCPILGFEVPPRGLALEVLHLPMALHHGVWIAAEVAALAQGEDIPSVVDYLHDQLPHLI